MCKHIHLVIKYTYSHLNHTPVESLNVPMISLNVWNEEILCKVKVLGEYTTTAAMKEDIQRDMDHVYALLDQCTDEDILQQFRKNIRAALNLVEVTIIEILFRFNRLSNEPSNKALSPQNHSSQLKNIIKLYQQKSLNQSTNINKHELKQSLLYIKISITQFT